MSVAEATTSVEHERSQESRTSRRTRPEEVTLDPGAQRLPPLRAFLLLRYTLIIATAYLLLVEEGMRPPPVLSILLIVLALASNVAIASLPARTLRTPYFGSAIIAIDTLWITVALLVSQRFTAEFFFLYFFILLLAAIGENLWLIAVAAVAVCCAYLYVLAAHGWRVVAVGVALAHPHPVPLRRRGVLRLSGRPHPRRAPPRPGSGPDQIRVPGDGFARAAHAAHRHSRLCRPAARGRVRPGAGRATGRPRQGPGRRRKPAPLPQSPARREPFGGPSAVRT